MRWRFLNYPIFQKWLVTRAILPIVAAGQNLEVFSETSLPLIERLSIYSLYLMLPEIYQGNRKITLTSFFAIQKINNLNTSSRQAWCPAVTDTSYYSVLKPYKSLKNLNWLIWHPLGQIYSWKSIFYELEQWFLIPSMIWKNCPAVAKNLKST